LRRSSEKGAVIIASLPHPTPESDIAIPRNPKPL